VWRNRPNLSVIIRFLLMVTLTGCALHLAFQLVQAQVICYNEMMDFTFLPHAIEEMQARQIPLQVVLEVLHHPQEIMTAQKGRLAYQSVVEINGKPYIVRVIVEPSGEVVTLYRSSKINKYQGESYEENTD